jgi:hypothetical protein
MTGITKENAREFAARGNAVKRELKRLREERLGKIDYLLDHAARIAKENDTLKTALAQATAEDQDIFRNRRLIRVRKQLDLIDQLIEDEMAKDEPDAGKLDRMANSALRLNEQERQLSNRSLPPTLKAGTVKPARRSTNSEAPEPASE